MNQDVNNLLSEIDALMLRIGDAEDTTPKLNELRQTGQFAVYDAVQDDIPKKFNKLTPKRVKVAISSSSSEELYTKKSIKPTRNTRKPGSVISRKPTSEISKARPTTPTVRDVFCVVCEQFIPLCNVTTHNCVENDNDDKLTNLLGLLNFKLELVRDPNLLTLIQILVACTESIIAATDSYQLQTCWEDLCILKNQLHPFLNSDEQGYSILTITVKIHEYASAKSAQLGRQTEQSVITNKQTPTKSPRRRLFQEAKRVELPKQLVRMSQLSRISGNILTNNNTTVVTNNSNIKQQQQQLSNKKPTNDNSTSITKKQGIVYGNEYDSSIKPQFITLSSGKKRQQQESPPQVQQQTTHSVISGISGFFSRLSSKMQSEGGNEKQKKHFFDLAVKMKDVLPQEHPGQFILIADMYDQCKRQQIPIEEWTQWIDQIYNSA